MLFFLTSSWGGQLRTKSSLSRCTLKLKHGMKKNEEGCEALQMDSRKITGWSKAWLLNYAGGKIKHHEDGRNLHGTRVSSIQPKPFWMRIWMRNPSPRYYVKASCDLRQEQVGIIQNVLFLFYFIFYFLLEPQSLTMHYIRDEGGDEALTLCRPMGLGFPAVRTRQEGKEKRYERQ